MEKIRIIYIKALFSFFHAWLVTAQRHPLQGGEILRAHPQYVYTKFDRQRLRLTQLERY
jgi:hypothetical protein